MMWVPLNDGTLVPGGSSVAKGSSMAISPRPMISASNAGVIVLVMEPISNAVPLIDRALGFRISAEIGSDRGAVFDDGRSDAGAGTVTLEALLERGTQIVFAGCHSRRLLKVLERGSEKVLSWPPAPLHDAIILSGRKTVEQARWTAGQLRVKGGGAADVTGVSGVTPTPDVPGRGPHWRRAPRPGRHHYLNAAHGVRPLRTIGALRCQPVPMLPPPG